MSESKKGYNTNPLDPKVAERAEAEMEPVDSEAPTRAMPPDARPLAGGPTHGFPGTAPGQPPTPERIAMYCCPSEPR